MLETMEARVEAGERLVVLACVAAQMEPKLFRKDLQFLGAKLLTFGNREDISELLRQFGASRRVLLRGGDEDMFILGTTRQTAPVFFSTVRSFSKIVTQQVGDKAQQMIRDGLGRVVAGRGVTVPESAANIMGLTNVTFTLKYLPWANLDRGMGIFVRFPMLPNNQNN